MNVMNVYLFHIKKARRQSRRALFVHGSFLQNSGFVITKILCDRAVAESELKAQIAIAVDGAAAPIGENGIGREGLRGNLQLVLAGDVGRDGPVRTA